MVKLGTVCNAAQIRCAMLVMNNFVPLGFPRELSDKLEGEGGRDREGEGGRWGGERERSKGKAREEDSVEAGCPGERNLAMPPPPRPSTTEQPQQSKS